MAANGLPLISGVIRFALLAALGVALSCPVSAQPAETFTKDWAELTAAAKKEGQLVVGLSEMPDWQSLFDAFTQKFGIHVQTQVGSGSARVTRLLAERKAGKFTADIGLVSVAASTRRLQPANALEELAPLLIHPDARDESKWYGGRHWYAGSDNAKSVLVMSVRAINHWSFWYNTEKLSAQDVDRIKSPWDILAAEWKGKLADQSWHDPGRLGDLMEAYFAPDAGPEWVRRYLSDMNVAFTSDPRLEETWLVRGRNPLKWGEGNIPVQLVDLSAKGLPIKRVLLEKQQGVLEARSSECCIMVFKNAPNPNAAKLFVNWFLTAEGQTLMNAILPPRSRTSLREDVPPGNTDPAIRRTPGKAYSFRDFDEQYLANEETARQAVVKMFNERTQR